MALLTTVIASHGPTSRLSASSERIFIFFTRAFSGSMALLSAVIAGDGSLARSASRQVFIFFVRALSIPVAFLTTVVASQSPLASGPASPSQAFVSWIRALVRSVALLPAVITSQRSLGSGIIFISFVSALSIFVAFLTAIEARYGARAAAIG